MNFQIGLLRSALIAVPALPLGEVLSGSLEAPMRQQQLLINAEGTPVSLWNWNRKPASYECTEVSREFCATTPVNPPTAKLVQTREQCYNSCLNLTEGYQNNPGSIMMREKRGIRNECRCCIGDRIQEDLYQSLNAKAIDVGNKLKAAYCGTTLQKCKEMCNKNPQCKSILFEKGNGCCTLTDQCHTKYAKKDDLQSTEITYYRPCSAIVTNGAPENQEGWVQHQCSGVDRWGATNLYRPLGDHSWTELANNTNFGSGSPVINGASADNHRPSFQKCKDLCVETPSCTYVHYCDYGSHGITGQCWGYSKSCASNQPGCIPDRARCAAVKNAKQSGVKDPFNNPIVTTMINSLQ